MTNEKIIANNNTAAPELSEFVGLLQQLASSNYPFLLANKIGDQVNTGGVVIGGVPAAIYYEMLAGLVAQVAKGLAVPETLVLEAVQRFVAASKLREISTALPKHP